MSLMIWGSAPDQTPVWQIATPSPLILEHDRATPLLVTVLAEKVTTPSIVHSTLREARTGALLVSQQLALCAEVKTGCTAPASLSKGSHQLYVIVSDTFCQRGEFKGLLYFQVDEKSDPTTVELTVYGSDAKSKWFGVASIFLGVAISILLTAYLRQYSARLDALAPASVLMSELDRLDARWGTAPPDLQQLFPKAQARLAKLRSDLAESTLDALNLLPGTLRKPFGGSDADAAAYRTYLSERSDAIAALAIVLGEGLDALEKAWKASPKHAAILTAASELDALAGVVKAPADATSGIAPILAKMEAAMVAAGAVQRAQPAGPLSRSRSTLEIRAQQTRIALAAWGFLALVTTVAGAAILVINNHGFGTALDYIQCFFWGLGVQTAGQQLQQLTPGGIATSLKLSLPA
jgi:hypothetical protein